METETIDLTDPLEEILKRKNWTPECLNERLSILAQRNVNNRNSKDGIITLNDLLGDYAVTDLTACAVSQPFETIELSDDEISDAAEIVSNEGYNNETVNEVQVIELSDLSDQNSCNGDQNEDDDYYDEFTYENSNLNDTSIELDDNNSQQSLEACQNGNLEIDELETVNVEVPNISRVVPGFNIEQALDDSNPQEEDSNNTVEFISAGSPHMVCANRTGIENVASENGKEKLLESSKSEDSRTPDDIKNLKKDKMEVVTATTTNLDVIETPDDNDSKFASTDLDDSVSFRIDLPEIECDNDNRQRSLDTVGSEVERVESGVSNGTINVDSDKTQVSGEINRNQALSDSGIVPLTQIPCDHVSYIKKAAFEGSKLMSSENGHTEVSETTDSNEKFFHVLSHGSEQNEKPLSISTESLYKEPEILTETNTGNGSEVSSEQLDKLTKEAENGGSKRSYTNRSCSLSNTDSVNKDNNSDHDYGGNMCARIIASPYTEENDLEIPDKSSVSYTNELNRGHSKDRTSVENNQANREEQNRIYAAPSDESSQTSNNSFDLIQEDNLIERSDLVSGNNSVLQDFSSNETKLAQLEAEKDRPGKQSNHNILADESRLGQSELHQNIAHSSKQDVEKEEESACDIETNFDKLEDIRRHLKLQLTSLRTKKKLDMFQEVKQTIANIDNVKETGSLSNLSDESNSLSNAEDSFEKSGSKVSTFRRISETESGCDNALIDKTDISFDSQEDDNVPNVFNEIRKIIRKSKSSSSASFAKTTSNSSSVTNTSPMRPQKSDTANGESETKRVDLEKPSSSITKKSEKSDLQSNNTVSSPFVSNSLDEFLNDSKLNVSYTIPKCDAEEGLKQDYSVDPIVPYDKKVKGESEDKSKKETKIKAKTLAEKRRLLEKKRKIEQKRLKKSLIKEELQKRSFVLFKNKKVFVQSKAIGKCFACIESDASNFKGELPTPVVKKPSLLKELYKKTFPVKYRPGPLCKKYLLQSDYSHWTTELKQLPRVTLSVMPEIGKPIHDNLLPIVSQWNGEITDTQVEFALSALTTKSAHNGQIFQFDVNYEKGQEKLLVRKKASNVTNIKLENVTTRTNSDPDADIAQVMENLIKYVEVKEIAPSLIKDDNPIDLTEGHTPLEPLVTNRNPKKKTSKLSRTSKELLRLNCKVVSTEVQESGQKTHCSKSFCKFGCICDSLKCKTMIGLHCQKYTCIFGCSCPKERGNIISIGESSVPVNSNTEFLSTDTVTRIEGEAKKNLARVEKEFTQTIICTNDKTIVVSTGNKVRRAARAPKKYSDFFDEDIFKEAGQEVKKERKPLVTPCTVSLEKWDFSDIKPYCLAHYLYNCHCRGFSAISSLKTEKVSNIEKDNQLNENTSKKPNNKVRTEEPTKLKRKLSDENIGCDTSSSETLISTSGRPVRKKKSAFNSDFVPSENIITHVSPESVKSSDYRAEHIPDISDYHPCSRTSEIPERFRSLKTFTNAATALDFVNNINEADILRLKLIKREDMLESDRFKAEVIKEKRRLLKTTAIEHRKKHERKQRIEVRQDENLKIKASRPVTNNELKDKISSVFNGEIIVNDSEWLRKLCNNSKQPLNGGYARILPWNALLKGFLSKSVNVYCICDMPLRLLLNVGEKIFRDKVLDIEMFGHKILEKPLKGLAPWLISQSENVRNIIKWLLSGTLPSKYRATSLSFLLVETLPGQFEVRGLCTQTENIENKGNNCDGGRTESEIGDDITEIKHKNMNHEIQSLFFTKAKYRLKELVEDGFDDDLTDNLYMWVGLPEAQKVAKWRVIFLKNDFAYLHFKNIKYTIKYTDLVKLTEMAKQENLTLLVRNLQIRRSYEHLAFGIYVSPTYQDRIFIGPYFINHNEEDVETLRYMNQSLVSSESLNRMKGYPDYKCGHWMYERPQSTPRNVPKETIDLTSDDSVKTTRVSRMERKLLSPQLAEEQTINHNGFMVHIKNSKPRAPSEFNRYIITNIPHFGYLGAYQPENSSILEVSWPFEKKVLQFENADHARDFLQERFNQLLQPVPETFKIQVIVLINLDLKEHQPINSDFLSGHCICGYFGTYNFKELTDDFCERELKTTKEEITKLFAKRAHEYIRKRITELAELAGVDPNDNVNYNIETIINKVRSEEANRMIGETSLTSEQSTQEKYRRIALSSFIACAKEEVKLQEQLRIQYIAEIQAKENVVIANIKRLFGMLRKLPIKERNIESKILNEILQIRPKRIGVNEVIEINDDDRTTGTNDLIVQKICTDQDNNESVLRCRKRRIGSMEDVYCIPKIAKVESLHSTSVTVLRKGEQYKTDKVDEVTENLPANLTR